MGQFTVGDVVAGFFPFSDVVHSGNAKKRPCLVIGHEEHGDVIIAQITSKAYGSQRAIKLIFADFASGKLPLTSYIRPDKLFTTDPALLDRKLGELKPGTCSTALQAVQALFNAGDNR